MPKLCDSWKTRLHSNGRVGGCLSPFLQCLRAYLQGRPVLKGLVRNVSGSGHWDGKSVLCAILIRKIISVFDQYACFFANKLTVYSIKSFSREFSSGIILVAQQRSSEPRKIWFFVVEYALSKFLHCCCGCCFLP